MIANSFFLLRRDSRQTRDERSIHKWRSESNKPPRRVYNCLLCILGTLLWSCSSTPPPDTSQKLNEIGKFHFSDGRFSLVAVHIFHKAFGVGMNIGATTKPGGSVLVPRLEPGDYEVSIIDVQKENFFLGILSKQEIRYQFPDKDQIKFTVARSDQAKLGNYQIVVFDENSFGQKFRLEKIEPDI